MYESTWFRAFQGSALSLVVLAAAATQEADAQQDSLHLRGRVADAYGQPVSGASVRDTVSGVLAVAGRDGRYELRLPGSISELLVTARGFHPVRVVLPAGGGAIVRNVVLQRVPELLPVVSITARTSTDLARIPGATATIGPDLLHDRAPFSVADALRTVPGIHTAEEDPLGLALNIGFRGLPPRRSARTLSLEDGMPVLLGPYGDPTMHYAPPPDAVELVEVIKGSGQVMNGPQTTGGVLNFVTRRPPTDGSAAEVALGGGGAGFRNSQLYVGTGGGGYGISFDHVYRESEGLRRDQQLRAHSGMLKGLFPVGGTNLLLKASVWDESSSTAETGLTEAEFHRDPYSLPFEVHGRFDVRRYAAQALHDAHLGERVRLRTNAYISHTNRASWRQSGESEERLDDDDYHDDFNCLPGATTYEECGNQGRPRTYLVAAVEPRLSVDIAGERAAAALDVGLRLYAEDVTRRQYLGNSPDAREDNATLTRDNDIDTRVVAAFGQTRVSMGALTLSPAIRVERVSQTVYNRYPGSEAAVDQSYTQLLPGIGGTLGVTAHSTLFAGVHRGFAPPRPADIYSPQPGESIALVDPETSWNWEAGARVMPVAGLSAEATFFRMDFGNEIIEAPAASGQRFINGGRTVHQGVEVAGSLSLGTLVQAEDDLRLRAAFTWLPTARFSEDDGRDFAGNRLPYAPRSLVSASAAYAHRSGITAGAAVEYTSAQFSDEENSVETTPDGQSGVLSAYAVVNAFASWELPVTGLQLRFSVRNLLDRVYITQRNEGIHTGVRRTLRAELRWYGGTGR